MNAVVDFNVLGDVITTFNPLLEKYRWGTQLPYMISGANSIPQKEVMSLVMNRAYSFDSIVRGLQNRKDHMKDNAKYPILKAEKYENVIIIGGGNTPVEHLDSVKAFISNLDSVALVFATARHAGLFLDVDVPHYYCLVGREAKRLKNNVSADRFKGVCVLPPYPRKLGTDVPEYAEKDTFEIAAMDFAQGFEDSCTALAIQTALNLNRGSIYVIGYDGYPGSVLSEKEVTLSNETKTLFNDYEKCTGDRMVSLTPSIYPELKVVSIYQFL